MKEAEKNDAITQFSKFVDKHPLLLKEIRSSDESIQSYFEKWTLLGENDPFWNQYEKTEGSVKKNTSKKEKKSDWIEEIMQYSKHVNLEQVQKHVQSVSEAVQSFQSIITQFKGDSNKSNKSIKQSNDGNLFQLFKD